MPHPPFTGVKPNINDVLDYAEELAEEAQREAHESAVAEARAQAAASRARRRLMRIAGFDVNGSSTVTLTTWSAKEGDGGNSGAQAIPVANGVFTVPESGLYLVNVHTSVMPGAGASAVGACQLNLYAADWWFQSGAGGSGVTVDTLTINQTLGLTANQTISVSVGNTASSRINVQPHLSIVRLGAL